MSNDASIFIFIKHIKQLISYTRLQIENEVGVIDMPMVRKNLCLKGYRQDTLVLSKSLLPDKDVKHRIHAQIHALQFYLKNGFKPSDNAFIAGNIKHIKIWKLNSF